VGLEPEREESKSFSDFNSALSAKMGVREVFIFRLWLRAGHYAQRKSNNLRGFHFPTLIRLNSQTIQPLPADLPLSQPLAHIPGVRARG
jgi:hypothetical protein